MGTDNFSRIRVDRNVIELALEMVHFMLSKLAEKNDRQRPIGAVNLMKI